jgi:putative membrane protein
VSASELEGRLHPLAALVLARRFVGASLIPVLALLLSLGTRMLVPLALAAVLVVALAVLWWWRFSYRVTGGRLEVRSGLVNRTTRVVTLDRVRGVELTAPFAHRLLGLVKVEIEAAAGGGQSEISLPAVSREQGEALRERLLGGARAQAEGEPSPALYRATPRRLALGGLTSGRYLLAPAAVVGVIFNVADNLPGGVMERAAEAVVNRAPTDPLAVATALVAGVVLVLLLAVSGSLLVDWNFVLRTEGDRLTAERGLLTRRTVSIDRDRIRGLDVRDTPLRRPLGLAAVTAIAGGVKGAGGRTTLAPVVAGRDVFRLLTSVDPQAPQPSAELIAHPRSARGRRLWHGRCRHPSLRPQSPPCSAGGGSPLPGSRPPSSSPRSRSTATGSLGTVSTAAAWPCGRGACCAAGRSSIRPRSSLSTCAARRRSGAPAWRRSRCTWVRAPARGARSTPARSRRKPCWPSCSRACSRRWSELEKRRTTGSGLPLVLTADACLSGARSRPAPAHPRLLSRGSKLECTPARSIVWRRSFSVSRRRRASSAGSDRTSTEGGTMYGRLVEVDGFDPSKRDEVVGIMRERIVPGLKEIDGFAGFISLFDDDTRRARTVLLWETREGAEEAERRFGPKREEIVRGVGATVRSTDLFEAPIVEVLTGARA